MSAPPAQLDVRDVALFLDVDGTLLDIREHPQDVTAEPALVDELHRVADALGGALALISGRALADIDRIFRPAEFAAAGAHGTEIRLHEGDVPGTDHPAIPAEVMRSLERFAEGHDGLLLERKVAGISLHYRRAPDLEAEARRVVCAVMKELGADFRLIDGKKVLEIAPAGHDKGEAIRHFLQHPPFRGRQPVFVGDDVTDEDGFRVVNELGGLSVRVGATDGSAAQTSIPDVDGVRRWLAGAVQPADGATGTDPR